MNNQEEIGKTGFWMVYGINVVAIIVFSYVMLHVFTYLSSPVVGYMAFFGLLLIFAGTGFGSVKGGKDPEKMMITILDRYTVVIYSSGLFWLPLWKIIFDGVPETAKVIDMPLQYAQGRTPNGVNVEMDLDMGYIIDFSDQPRDDGKGNFRLPFTTYIVQGGTEQVKRQLGSTARTRTRAFLISSTDGPPDHKSAYKLSDMAAQRIIESIGKVEGLIILHSSLPPEVLFKYFELNDEPFTQVEIDRYGGDPTAHIQRTILSDESKYTQEVNDSGKASYEEMLKEEVELRYRQMQELKDGAGEVCVPGYGIKLVRLNIVDIRADKKAEDAQLAVALEEDRRERELKDARTNAEQMKIYKKAGLNPWESQMAIQAGRNPEGGFNQIVLQFNPEALGKIDLSKVDINKVAAALGVAVPTLQSALTNAQQQGTGKKSKGGKKKFGSAPGGGTP